jgi:ABC-type nitrate/sulfonate/bicarbonate transport system permease component
MPFLANSPKNPMTHDQELEYLLPETYVGVRGILRKYESVLLGVVGLVLLLLIWSVVSLLGLVPQYVIPPPYLVALSTYDLFASGEILPHLIFSLQELSLGYCLGASSGVAIGLLMGWYKRVNYLLEMVVSALYSTPRIALVPLFLIVFGVIGIWKTVALVFMMTFFPVLINTLTGVKLCEASYVRVGRALGARGFQLIWDVLIPGSVPSIISGLRLGVGYGLTALVVGDSYGAQAGLGYLLFLFANAFRTADMVAVIVVFSISGIVLNAMLRRIENHFSAWRPNVAE